MAFNFPGGGTLMDGALGAYQRWRQNQTATPTPTPAPAPAPTPAPQSQGGRADYRPYTGDYLNYGQGGEWNFFPGQPAAPGTPAPVTPGTPPAPDPDSYIHGILGDQGGNGNPQGGGVGHSVAPGSDTGGGFSLGGYGNGGYGQVNLGRTGRALLRAAGFIPGPLGTIASVAGLALRGYNTNAFNSQLKNVGLPQLNFGQELGAVLGLNGYGSGQYGSYGAALGMDSNGQYSNVGGAGMSHRNAGNGGGYTGNAVGNVGGVAVNAAGNRVSGVAGMANVGGGRGLGSGGGNSGGGGNFGGGSMGGGGGAMGAGSNPGGPPGSHARGGRIRRFASGGSTSSSGSWTNDMLIPLIAALTGTASGGPNVGATAAGAASAASGASPQTAAQIASAVPMINSILNGQDGSPIAAMVRGAGDAADAMGANGTPGVLASLAQGTEPSVSIGDAPRDDRAQPQYAGGGHVPGDQPGQSDKVRALLSDGEYVMDADSVSALGDGNNAAGAKKLDMMRRAIRTHKRSAPASKIPPQAKSITAYLGGRI